MNRATLRGFDFLHTDLMNRLRFCNPIVSFSESENPEVYLARRLDWYFNSDTEYNWLTPLSRDVVGSFGTLVTQNSPIKPGEGVIVIGDKFVAAAESVGIDILHSRSCVFERYSETSCFIGIAEVSVYEEFASNLTNYASVVFDSELSPASESLPDRASAALFLMRHCSITPLDVLARYELVAAYLDGVDSIYERLLSRFAIELERDRSSLSTQVQSHLMRVRLESTIPVISARPYESPLRATVLWQSAANKAFRDLWVSRDPGAIDPVRLTRLLSYLRSIKIDRYPTPYLQGSLPMSTTVQASVWPQGRDWTHLLYSAAVGERWSVKDRTVSVKERKSLYETRVYARRRAAWN